jgi:hypothetical protein
MAENMFLRSATKGTSGFGPRGESEAFKVSPEEVAYRAQRGRKGHSPAPLA